MKNIELQLEEEFYKNVQEFAMKYGFRDINECIEFILDELIKNESSIIIEGESEEDMVKQRLKSLGYLD